MERHDDPHGYGPAAYVNRVIILMHPSGGKGSVMVCFADASQVEHVTGTYDSIAEATPDIEKWCNQEPGLRWESAGVSG